MVRKNVIFKIEDGPNGVALSYAGHNLFEGCISDSEIEHNISNMRDTLLKSEELLKKKLKRRKGLFG